MKILFIANTLGWGGAETLAINEAVELKKRGHHVDFLIFGSNISSVAEKKSKEMNIDIQLINLGNEGIRRTFKINPSVIIQIRRKISKYDIVHIHLIRSLFNVAISSICLLRKIPIVYTVHTAKISSLNGPLKFKWFFRWVFNKCSRIITIVDDVESMAKDYFKNIDTKVKTELIYNAIGPEWSSYTPEIHEKNGKNLVTVGRLHKVKNTKMLIDAVSQVNDIKLTIYGDGPLRNDLDKYIKLKKVNNRIFLLGNKILNSEELSQYDYFATATTSEAFSLAWIEALASGLPIVVPDIYKKSIITPGKNGYIFKNEDDLIKIIKNLKDNNKKLNEMSINALEFSKEFTIKNHIDKLLKVYSDII